MAFALRQVVDCKRIGLSVVGTEVPHVHVHLIPINALRDMTFQHKEKMTEEEFKDLAEQVAEVYLKL